MIQEKHILLLKSQDNEDKFGSMLTENGFTVKYLQVLKFVFVNIQSLSDELKKVHDYSGIIFTSPRSVTATKMALNDKQIDKEWHEKNNFVVGETTFSSAKNQLGLTCFGKDSGNANNLADIILKDKYVKPFLFPCGNLKKDTLYQRFKEYNLELKCVTVYETQRDEKLEKNFEDLSNDFDKIPEYFLYFSPSGVNFTTELMKNLPLDKLKLIAIGPSTEKSMKQASWPVFAVASQPNATEVINAILEK